MGKFDVNEIIIKLRNQISKRFGYYTGDNYINLNSIDDYGEYLVMKRLYNNDENNYKNKGTNVMRNFISQRHFMDLSIQIWNTDKNGIKILNPNYDKVDVKTYPRYKNWNITGMNYSHWLEYKQIPKDQKMMIIWVDYYSGFIYGNYVDRLIELEQDTRPYFMNCSTGAKQNWNVDDMIRFNDLFNFDSDNSNLSSKEIVKLKDLCINKF